MFELVVFFSLLWKILALDIPDILSVSFVELLLRERQA